MPGQKVYRPNQWKTVFLNETVFKTFSRRENQQFPAGKSAGYDNIPMAIIKRSINSISSPLTHIVNLSIIHGIVPNELKFARVVPIFKSGDKALFSNDRPISVLPCFSKILERIIYNRIINYLNDFNVLCDNQYGSGRIVLLASGLSTYVTEFLLLSIEENMPLECS